MISELYEASEYKVNVAKLIIFLIAAADSQICKIVIFEEHNNMNTQE